MKNTSITHWRAAHDAAIQRLEDAIGLRPGDKSLPTTTIANKRGLFTNWLIEHGIDEPDARYASTQQVHKAYTIFPNYIGGWLRRQEQEKESGSKRYTRSNPSSRPPVFDLDSEQESEAPNSDEGSLPLDSALSESQIRELIRSTLSDEVLKLAQAEAKSAALLRAGELILENNKRITQNLTNSIMELVRLHKSEIDRLVKSELDRRIPPQKLEIVLTSPSGESRSTLLGPQHKMFPTLLRLCALRLPTGFRPNLWLTGPTGSGKTTAAESAAHALNLPFASDGSLDADYKVMGFRDANGHVVSTEFIRVFRDGGIYCADEIDNWLPSALLSLNSALANGWFSTPGGMIKRHPDFLCIACANTWGLGATNEYIGRTRLDAASLDRFGMKLNWEIDEELEFALIASLGPKAEAWHKVIKLARQAAKSQGLQIIISPRSTLSGATMLTSGGFGYKDTIALTFGAGISQEQLTALNLPTALPGILEESESHSRPRAVA